ncbi:MAG: uncharacterized protein PWQ88_809 [Candidatus Methanomethylophilaceae archaeon]|nr:uncharacterized protein [Candidatus Methanomethylophilaceae archaeon]MDI3541205.1 uncharacterized protein [Candidatus Methanomethylophilaceae archaeon]HIJ00579.1 twitching motility protein PilT [Candidatus Methanomethylophilaceae archaeon]
MRTVVLDANALLMPFELNINLDLELQRLIGDHRTVVPGPIVGELKRCGARQSGAALALARKYDIIPVSSSGDDAVIDLARELHAYVVTNDKELRSRLRKEGIPLIYLRSGHHLVLED